MIIIIIKIFSRVCCVRTLWSTSCLPWAPYLLLSSSTLPYSTLYPQLEIIWFKPLNTTTRVLCRYSSGNLNSSVLKGIEPLPQILVFLSLKFASQCRRTYIIQTINLLLLWKLDINWFQTINYVWLNKLSLKYQRFIPSGYKYLGIRQFECVEKIPVVIIFI